MPNAELSTVWRQTSVVQVGLVVVNGGDARSHLTITRENHRVWRKKGRGGGGALWRERDVAEGVRGSGERRLQTCFDVYGDFWRIYDVDVLHFVVREGGRDEGGQDSWDA